MHFFSLKTGKLTRRDNKNKLVICIYLYVLRYGVKKTLHTSRTFPRIYGVYQDNFL